MPRNPLRHLRDDAEGAISVMAAVLIAALVMATSLAVDVGRVAFTSRDQQGVTDRIALNGVRTLSEDAPADATYQDLYDLVVADAARTLDVNTQGTSVGTAKDRQIDAIQLGYVSGGQFHELWGPGGAGDCAATFLGPGETYGGPEATAVRAVTGSFVDFVFGFMDSEGGRQITKSAVAATRLPHDDGYTDPTATPSSDPCGPTPEYLSAAGVEVATRLVDFDSSRSELLAPIMQDLLGSSTTLTLVGFDGLATANLPLAFLGNAGADIGTVDQLLDSQVTLTDLFTAAASGLSNQDAAANANAITALGELSAAVDPALTFRVGDIISADTEDTDTFLTSEVNMLDWIMAAAMSARLATGDHLLELNLSGSDLLGQTGLLDVALGVTLVEAPQSDYGPAEFVPENDANGDGFIQPDEAAHWVTQAHTAQLAADLSVGINTYYADSLLGPITNLVSGLLCLTGPLACGSQTVDLSIQAARADASLVNIDCTEPVTDSNADTVVTSDTLVATVGGADQTLVSSRNGTVNYGVEGEVVHIDSIPGVGVTSDASVSGIAVFDAVLQPVLGLLGIDTGTAQVRTFGVDCSIPGLLGSVS